jgi:uncharacterized protein (DUF1330 family)
MSAYVITDVRVVDEAGVEEYRRIAKDSIKKYGGRYLSLSQNVESLEGDWSPEVIVILEFPDADTARAWFHSPEYAPALPLAKACLSREMILVDAARPATAPAA